MTSWMAIGVVALVLVGLAMHAKLRSFQEVGTHTKKSKKDTEEGDEEYRNGDHCWRKECGAQHSVLIKPLSTLDTFGIPVDGTASFAGGKAISFAFAEEDKIKKASCTVCGKEKIF